MSVLCIALLPHIPIGGQFDNTQVPNVAYSPHAPISIQSNADLATFCDGNGTGTEGDPYIIENLEISSCSTAIFIKNTNSYLCIRNNKMTGFTDGIIILGAQNVNISSNIFSNSGPTGQCITVSQYSQNIVFHNNTMTDAKSGVYAAYSSNVKILSNTIQRMDGEGIVFEKVDYGETSSNIIEHCHFGGVRFETRWGSSNHHTLTNNTFTQYGFIFSNNPKQFGIENLTIDTSNKINGRSIRYYEKQTGLLLNDPDVGQLILNGVNNSEFRGFNVSYSGNGIFCENSHNNTFSDIESNDQYRTTGFIFSGSTHNSITSCKIEYNTQGIMLMDSSITTITKTSIKNNSRGIYIYENSRDNHVFHNAFVNNTNHIEFQGSEFTNTIWDDGTKGNYWADYTMKYPDATNDGKIWNTPYNISTSESDRYPLVYSPLSQMEQPCLSTPSNQSSNGNITLNWDAIEEAEFYLVYRSNSTISSEEGLTPLANTTATMYNENITTNGTYYYVVVAGNEFKRSEISNNVEIEVAIPPPEPDDPPQDPDDPPQDPDDPPQVPDDPPQDPDDPPQDPDDLQIDGFPFAIFGIICVITLMVKRRRIES